ncbi:hypothetical protein SPRG_14511 [Saprolegnia parasitica CBS 223.65]|uniref:Uncharacterized protein n=1 Tax=Saprolegnia parasitica (strain CBS 223.65) TaxID=695850 RepID=A0A067BPI4_SAPPC|nr:hypothetical protein SPRG_14511 [Saprolegnia parasitica CBS 223.65]KDO20163.1 hypothetical protein SPRG_14511 [Saprolegnia parasitica CBS 223.65]|eukprot:XP_012209112.1 hypothetical protein SPRG_14511 [Saprolegnia parasitica CBS 223.65]
MLAPVQPSIRVAPQCASWALQRQIVCSAGTFTLGSSAQLLLLLVLVLLCNKFWYVAVRLLFTRSTSFITVSIEWRRMDRASAMVSGLLSVRHGGERLLFDIKTWRLHRLSALHTEKRPSDDVRLDYALPLRT